MVAGEVGDARDWKSCVSLRPRAVIFEAFLLYGGGVCGGIERTCLASCKNGCHAGSWCKSYWTAMKKDSGVEMLGL